MTTNGKREGWRCVSPWTDDRVVMARKRAVQSLIDKILLVRGGQGRADAEVRASGAWLGVLLVLGAAAVAVWLVAEVLR